MPVTDLRDMDLFVLRQEMMKAEDLCRKYIQQAAKAAADATKAQNLLKEAHASCKRLEEQKEELTQMHETYLEAIESHITCKICITRMRKACSLNDCGHTFCQNCLVELFRKGQYTCPLCRNDVTRVPVSCFVVRDIVETYERAAESDEILSADEGKGKNIASISIEVEAFTTVDGRRYIVKALAECTLELLLIVLIPAILQSWAWSDPRPILGARSKCPRKSSSRIHPTSWTVLEHMSSQCELADFPQGCKRHVGGRAVTMEQVRAAGGLAAASSFRPRLSSSRTSGTDAEHFSPRAEAHSMHPDAEEVKPEASATERRMLERWAGGGRTHQANYYAGTPYTDVASLSHSQRSEPDSGHAKRKIVLSGSVNDRRHKRRKEDTSQAGPFRYGSGAGQGRRGYPRGPPAHGTLKSGCQLPDTVPALDMFHEPDSIPYIRALPNSHTASSSILELSSAGQEALDLLIHLHQHRPASANSHTVSSRWPRRTVAKVTIVLYIWKEVLSKPSSLASGSSCFSFISVAMPFPHDVRTSF
ncbi:hypothetical protein K488DRAFT_71297 [Vararia minispora EC-137]|uniref:Uncharacterized protein n=1 Tax=Vararia minispora EC-137 TaxID=1314806 RepID=A0ACB8QIU2_9AGAM|nr:hypothetical protein K488DRAFT_71297 [Vararia minispora EC-137]